MLEDAQARRKGGDMRRILLFADGHLQGRELSWPMSEKYPDITLRTQDRLDRLHFIADLAEQEDVTDVVILGDLFNSPTPPEPVVREMVGIFNRIMQPSNPGKFRKITYLIGNHDRGVRRIPLSIEEVAWDGFAEFSIMRSPLAVSMASSADVGNAAPRNVVFVPAPSDGNMSKAAGYLASVVPEEQRASTIVFGHFPVMGAVRSRFTRRVKDMYNDCEDLSDEGVPSDLLEQFEHVSLGDFHHPSKFYVGSLVRNRFSESSIVPRVRIVQIEPAGSANSIEVSHFALPDDRPLVHILFTDKETVFVGQQPVGEGDTRYGRYDIGTAFPAIQDGNVGAVFGLVIFPDCGLKLDFEGPRVWLTTLNTSRVARDLRTKHKAAMVHVNRVRATDVVLQTKTVDPGSLSLESPLSHWGKYGKEMKLSPEVAEIGARCLAAVSGEE